MFEHSLYPESIQPQKLDELLSKGWFRMGQSIFTTHFTLFDHRIYRTIWLRHTLKDFEESSTILKLKKRNKNFSIKISKAKITDKHELLFEKYKSSIYFHAASSLDHLLNGYAFHLSNIFNTYEINLYHEDKLIACSYFDIGYNSAEGICSYYDPAYKLNSLGRYLIYLQIEVCKVNGLAFYYPGYFVPGYAHLDYKLNIGTSCLQFLNPENFEWQPIEQYNDQGIPIEFQEYFILK